MRKLLLAAFLVTMFLAPAAADVQYRGVIGEDEVRMNTSIQLECDDPCPVSRWNLAWSLPENAEITGIQDSLGEIDDYERTGSSVSITTNSGEPRRQETIKISMVVRDDAENVYEDLHYRRLSLPSLSGEETTGVFQVEDMISGWVGHRFESSFDGQELRIQGTGATNIRVNFGQGQETEFYEFFGDDRDNSSEAYRIAVGTTGIVQQFPRFPVAVMPPGVYNETRPSWSAGEYTAGNIALRDNLEENYLPTLAHETVHGLNDRFLKWDQTRSSYLDEGVSEHAEYLMQKKLYRNQRVKTGTRQVFGEDEEYRVREDDGVYIYTRRSQGDKERLWEYYQQGGEIMKDWNPSRYPDYRDFGYAYSELLIKHHIVKNDETVRDLYSDIAPGRAIDSPEEKWDYLSQHMEMEPCNYDSRDRFDSCLEEVNSHDYAIYSASSIQRESSVLEFGEIEVPNRTRVEQKNTETQDSSEYGFQDFIRGFVQYLLSFVK